MRGSLSRSKMQGSWPYGPCRSCLRVNLSRLTRKGTKWQFLAIQFFTPKVAPISQKYSKKIFKKSSVVTEIQLFEYYRFGGNRTRLKTLMLLRTCTMHQQHVHVVVLWACSTCRQAFRLYEARYKSISVNHPEDQVPSLSFSFSDRLSLVGRRKYRARFDCQFCAWH